MDLILKRNKNSSDGIFGKLYDLEENLVAFTLEHAFLFEHEYYPALPEGVYTCKRGPHRLESMITDFETFEVENVAGHRGILFHVGNYNKDSSGCILLGSEVLAKAIMNSRVAFTHFMDLQKGVDTFTLTVQNLAIE